MKTNERRLNKQEGNTLIVPQIETITPFGYKVIKWSLFLTGAAAVAVMMLVVIWQRY